MEKGRTTVKLHIVRRIAREGSKEYAVSGMVFSARTSKAWGLGALKNALWNVIYYRSYLETKEIAIMRYIDKVSEVVEKVILTATENFVRDGGDMRNVLKGDIKSKLDKV